LLYVVAPDYLLTHVLVLEINTVIRSN